jgi:hypothetical protein
MADRFTLDLRASRSRLITDGERVTRAWNGWPELRRPQA